MKTVFALLFLVVTGCSENKNNNPQKLHRSHAQASIETLVDSFKTEYLLAPSPEDKNLLIQKYKTKIDRFLSNHYLNHMRVHIDSVTTDQLTIVTRFHTNENVVFHCLIEFKKPMPPKEETLYQFMHNLKTGTDTSIDFEYLGKFELNYPNESSDPTLQISAVPQSYQMHGHK